MKAEDLKNYGKGFADIMPDPEKMEEKRMTMFEALRGELGPSAMAKLARRMNKEIKPIGKHDWSRLTDHGVTDRGFLDWLIETIAVMNVLVDIVGMEKASDIHRRLLDKMPYGMVALTVFPSADDFKACQDAFDCFKEYSKAMNVANVRTGIHEVEMVEDTVDVLAWNVRYCAWHEVANEFGDPYLCYPSACYSDEVFFPWVGTQVGFQFKRAGTLATGAPVCDFRFERIVGRHSEGS